MTTTPSRTWRRGGCGRETYAEPFALRALGVARGDAQLLDEASSRFRAIGLGWRADETEDWRAKTIVA